MPPQESFMAERVAAAEELVTRYRRLVRTDPDRYLADLGRALGELRVVLTKLPDRFDELAAVMREEIDVYRRLADSDRRYRPRLAASLQYFGMVLSAHGHWDDAGRPMEEATDLYRALADADPETHLPDLALSLTNLGNQLAELGRHEEALDCMREAVVLHRGLARADTGAGGLAFASSLTDLGIKLGEMGIHEEAVTVLQEAIERYRAVGTPPGERPLRYWLALVAHSHELAALGRDPDARRSLHEATALYHELVRTEPDLIEFCTALLRKYGLLLTPDGWARRAVTDDQHPSEALTRANALTERGLRLAGAGRLTEALPLHEEAVGLCRQVAAADPNALPELAKTLYHLGLVRAWLGRHGEALEATSEAVRYYRKMALSAPDSIDPLLADALDSLGARLAAVERHSDAASVAEESVDRYRRLVESDPHRHSPDLARALNNFGIRLCDIGRHSEAYDATREAVELCRRRYLTDGTDLPVLLSGLANLSLRLARLDRPREAAATTAEAVQLVSAVSNLHPGNHLGGVAESLAWLGWYLKRERHHREGHAATEAAAALRRRLATG